MKIGKPSPALVVSIIALVMATSGSAVAAVNFARNAGAVDGKSASGAGTSLSKVRGRLVATARGGANAGRIPHMYLADVARAESFAAAAEVNDNASGADNTLDTSNGLVRLSASCNDQSNVAGREDPASRITITNSSGRDINLARRAGVGGANVVPLANGTTDSFVIAGSNTFELQLETFGTSVLVNGVVRQDGAGTGAASCLVYGTTQLVR
jgi:hypothetical protein